jgi:Cu(I)/Ag(I) efflux system membrane protein CusA/SilA
MIQHRAKLNRMLIATYQPLLDAVLRWPKSTLAAAGVALLVSLWPLQHIGVALYGRP